MGQYFEAASGYEGHANGLLTYGLLQKDSAQVDEEEASEDEEDLQGLIASEVSAFLQENNDG